MRWFLPFILLLNACSTTPNIATSNWKKFNLDVLTIDLIDDNEVQWLSFHKGGYVSATFGDKRWLAGPLFEWKLQNGKLVIFDTEKRIYEELTLTSASQNYLTAIRKSGQIARYKIQKQ